MNVITVDAGNILSRFAECKYCISHDRGRTLLQFLSLILIAGDVVYEKPCKVIVMRIPCPRDMPKYCSICSNECSENCEELNKILSKQFIKENVEQDFRSRIDELKSLVLEIISERVFGIPERLEQLYTYRPYKLKVLYTSGEGNVELQFKEDLLYVCIMLTRGFNGENKDCFECTECCSESDVKCYVDFIHKVLRLRGDRIENIVVVTYDECFKKSVHDNVKPIEEFCNLKLFTQEMREKFCDLLRRLR